MRKLCTTCHWPPFSAGFEQTNVQLDKNVFLLLAFTDIDITYGTNFCVSNKIKCLAQLKKIVTELTNVKRLFIVVFYLLKTAPDISYIIKR